MKGKVRTVLGDLDPGLLGPTNYHEHVFQITPLLPGDELDDEELSQLEVSSLKSSGFESMVDATPIGLGRRPEAVARISLATRLSIVIATGVHRREHYGPHHPVLTASVEKLAEKFDSDLVNGTRVVDDWRSEQEMAHTPDGSRIRAGIVKVGIGYWSIDQFAMRAVKAASQVAASTGAPIMVHLESGSAAHEVLDRFEGLGVSPDRIVLAHIDRNPDPGLHTELASRGAFLGFDGAARHRNWPDSVLLTCIEEVIANGSGSRVLLGGDVARRSRYISYGGMPGLAYLGNRFVPRLRASIGSDALNDVLIDNPRRLLTWTT